MADNEPLSRQLVRNRPQESSQLSQRENGPRTFELSNMTIGNAYFMDHSSNSTQQIPSLSSTQQASTSVTEHDVLNLAGSIKIFKNKKLHRRKQIYLGEKTTVGEPIPLVVKLTDYSKEALREAKSLHSTDFHPNVVRIYDSGTFIAGFKFIYMAMERCCTETLFDYMKRNKQSFDPCQAIQHSAQIISGLEYIHSKGIAHRDLKPDNILFSAIDGYDQIKIADFGMSKNYLVDPRATTGVTPGTMGFIAPELIKNKRPIDATKCDIFSLGILLVYRLSNGKHPYGKEDYHWTSNIAKGAKPDLTKLVLPSTSQKNAAVRVIKKMLQQSPETRPAAQDLRNEWTKEVGDFVEKTLREESETSIMSFSQERQTETRKGFMEMESTDRSAISFPLKHPTARKSFYFTTKEEDISSLVCRQALAYSGEGLDAIMASATKRQRIGSNCAAKNIAVVGDTVVANEPRFHW